MPKKTKKQKLEADKHRQTNSSVYTYTFSHSEEKKVTKEVEPENINTKYIKKDLFKSLFLTVIGITALIILSTVI
ncbi:hypothetical protein HYT02_04560 [Candidatus Gottesmanbacteria bacterium]|nr:hypothetical protein [Candidatus Gottesmanbacteria bacterium]